MDERRSETRSPVLSRRAAWSADPPISRLMAQTLSNPGLISLAAGFVNPATLPVAAADQVIHDLLADDEVARRALQYGSTAGSPRLRSLLLEQFLRDAARPAAATLDQVLVTAGSNQLLHLVAECLLDPGDVVLCAAPTYFAFLGLIQAVGGVSHSIASDQGGMLPDALEETLRNFDRRGELARIKAIYLVPYFDNPAGRTMPGERVHQIVTIAQSWSRRQHLYVIADEAYRRLRYHGDETPSVARFDDGRHVIVAGTFSKPFSPGLRVGWGVLPKSLAGPVHDLKGNIDFGAPHFAQEVAASVLEHGLLEPHVRTLCDSYRRKLDAMLSSANEFLGTIPEVQWSRPSGGLYVWLTVPPAVDTGVGGVLFQQAVAAGVLYVPGEYCFAAAGEPRPHHTIRLSFGDQPEDRIRTGMRLLALALRTAMDRPA